MKKIKKSQLKEYVESIMKEGNDQTILSPQTEEEISSIIRKYNELKAIKDKSTVPLDPKFETKFNEMGKQVFALFTMLKYSKMSQV